MLLVCGATHKALIHCTRYQEATESNVISKGLINDPFLYSITFRNIYWNIGALMRGVKLSYIKVLTQRVTGETKVSYREEDKIEEAF